MLTSHIGATSYRTHSTFSRSTVEAPKIWNARFESVGARDRSVVRRSSHTVFVHFGFESVKENTGYLLILRKMKRIFSDFHWHLLFSVSLFILSLSIVAAKKVAVISSNRWQWLERKYDSILFYYTWIYVACEQSVNNTWGFHCAFVKCCYFSRAKITENIYKVKCFPRE